MRYGLLFVYRCCYIKIMAFFSANAWVGCDSALSTYKFFGQIVIANRYANKFPGMEKIAIFFFSACLSV